MSDDTTNGVSHEFLLLETQMQRGVAPPRPAVATKTPRCGYCGQELFGVEKKCIFCPSHEPQEEEEFSPTMTAVCNRARHELQQRWGAGLVSNKQWEEIRVMTDAQLAKFLGLRNKVPSP